MPYMFGCPQCGSKLKTAVPVAADRSIQCPKCKHMFTTGDTVVEEIPAASPLTAPAARRESDTSELPRRDIGTRSRGGRDDEPRNQRRDTDEDDQPRRRGQDDDEPRSRRRRDYDDEPRSRRRREDDYDDEPRSRRRRDDDDDDEPRSRRRRDDDYDDEPRSRRRRDDDDDDRSLRRRPARRSNAGMMVALGALALLLLGGVVAAVVWLMGGSNFDKEMLSYLPKNTAIVFALDIGSLLKMEDSKEALKKPELQEPLRQLKEKTGLEAADFDRLVIGLGDIDVNNLNKEPEVVLVVRAKKSLDKEKIVKELNAQKKQANGADYYLSPKGDHACIHFPSDELLILTSTEGLMTDTVMKSDGTIRFSEELQEMVKPISKNQVWGAMLLSAQLREKMQIPEQNKQMVRAILPKVGALLDFLPKARGFALYAHNDGKESKFGLGMKLTDSDEADKFANAAKEAVASSIEQLMNMLAAFGQGKMQIPDDVKKFATDTANNTKADRSGSVGYVVITFDNKETKKLMDKYKQQLDNFNARPPFGVRPPDPAPFNPQPKVIVPRKGNPFRK